MNSNFFDADSVRISRTVRPSGEEGETKEELTLYIHGNDTCDIVTISSKSGKALRVEDGG